MVNYCDLHIAVIIKVLNWKLLLCSCPRRPKFLSLICRHHDTLQSFVRL